TGKVREALKGVSYQAPEGLVTIEPANNQTHKIVQIGKARPDGQFEIVWKTNGPVAPDPYPSYGK
ncbi:MAG: ABC transporter substrate-binding protein, partial [Spirochaetales bacterium]|nr:ABC transporter substrate-binding protein [Spirochaetales bacterium]